MYPQGTYPQGYPPWGPQSQAPPGWGGLPPAMGPPAKHQPGPVTGFDPFIDGIRQRTNPTPFESAAQTLMTPSPAHYVWGVCCILYALWLVVKLARKVARLFRRPPPPPAPQTPRFDPAAYEQTQASLGAPPAMPVLVISEAVPKPAPLEAHLPHPQPVLRQTRTVPTT